MFCRNINQNNRNQVNNELPVLGHSDQQRLTRMMAKTEGNWHSHTTEVGV